MTHIVVIRVDASIQIGVGHLMRCLALADALVKSVAAKVHFVCRGLSKDLEQLIIKSGHSVHQLALPKKDYINDSSLRHAEWLGANWREDADELSAFLKALKPNYLIIDHYAIDARCERQQRNYVEQIVIIDDLADRQHDCDVLIDQNFYLNMDARYDQLVPVACRKLLGPRYALLRPEFALERENVQLRNGIVQQVLIFFGGSDLENLTLVALRGLLKLKRSVNVDVVVGSAYPHFEELRAECEQFTNVHLHVQTKQMEKLLLKADFAIGASGTSNWERCCLGVPALLFSIAYNQDKLLEDLCEAAYVVGMAPEEVITVERMSSLLETVLLSPPLLRGLSTRSFSLVDGKGLARIVSILNGDSSVSIRKASAADSEMAWYWRNNEKTLKCSFDSSPISFDSHQEWWIHSLEDNNRILLVGSVNAEAVGILRFDLAKTVATVSIYLDPAKIGLGFGAKLLTISKEWVAKNLPQIKRLDALIKHGNDGSKSSFVSAGFKEQYSCFSLDL